MRLPRCQYWLVVAVLAVVGGGVLLGPGVRHRHAEGDVPHTHLHGHAHSHSHSHPHLPGHNHSDVHEHEAISVENGWHTHISIFGWQLTLFGDDTPQGDSTRTGFAAASKLMEQHLPFVVQATFETQLLPGPDRMACPVLRCSGWSSGAAEMFSGRGADAPVLPPPEGSQI